MKCKGKKCTFFFFKQSQSCGWHSFMQEDLENKGLGDGMEGNNWGLGVGGIVSLASWL